MSVVFDSAASTSTSPALKKPKKKKLLKQRPKQKSAFNLKKKPQKFSRHAAQPKSKPLSRTKSLPKLNLKPKNKVLSARLKVDSSAAMSARHHLSVPQMSHPKSRIQMKTRSRRTASSNQNPKTRLKCRLKRKPKRTSSQYQNVSQPESVPPTFHPTEHVGIQPVWDTSVQAAIRVGDWKLLTGDPGHGEWVPPQVLPTLPGRWWNLERAFASLSKSSQHKNIWLFNITDDPYERRDLADQRPDVVQQLLARLVYYNQTAVPVYFPPDDPRANPSEHDGAWVPWVAEEEEEGDYQGVYKKGRNSNNNKKKKKTKKCRLCKLKSFFLKLNTRMMSNRI